MLIYSFFFFQHTDVYICIPYSLYWNNKENFLHCLGFVLLILLISICQSMQFCYRVYWQLQISFVHINILWKKPFNDFSFYLSLICFGIAPSRCALILPKPPKNAPIWFHFPFLEGGLLVTLMDCMIFLSPFLDVPTMSMSTVSFHAQLENYLPIKCFPLTYDLSGFKSRINRHLLSVGSFWTDFLYVLFFLCFFFL